MASAEQDPAPNTDWQTLYRRFASDERNQVALTDRVALNAWPQLDAVPDEYIGTVARICALLWVKPTAGHLIAPILDEDRVHTNLLLQVLHAQGYVEFESFATDHMATIETEATPVTAQPSGRLSLIDRLRQQLIGNYYLR